MQWAFMMGLTALINCGEDDVSVESSPDATQDGTKTKLSEIDGQTPDELQSESNQTPSALGRPALWSVTVKSRAELVDPKPSTLNPEP